MQEDQTHQPTSWSGNLSAKLSGTRALLSKPFLIFKNEPVSPEFFEQLEEALIASDIGVDLAIELSEALFETRKKYKHADDLKIALRDKITSLLSPLEQPLIINQKPFMILMVGVNGAGKTTTLAKIAKFYQKQDYKVLCAAGDTFRAAAREQLLDWGEKHQIQVLAPQSPDPAAVIYDSLKAAQARKSDILIADTAGRQSTQTNLMTELEKVKRVMSKLDTEAPHETLLVIDAHHGQNALSQLKSFDKLLNVDGLVLTKLDGSAKGGIALAIAKHYPKPIRFIGTGESAEDIQPFSASQFSKALLE